MPKITKRMVDAVVPPPAGHRPDFLWDDAVKGFALRTTPGGTKTFILTYRTQEGRQRQFTIGRYGSPWTVENARRRAMELLHQNSQGVDPAQAKVDAKNAMTVEQLFQYYMTEGPIARPRKKAASWANDRSLFQRHIIPLIGKRTLRSLTKHDVSKMQADIAAGKTAKDEKTRHRGRAIVRGGRVIAGHAVVSLRAAINMAMDVAGITENPTTGVQINKSDGKERFLSVYEAGLIGEALAQMEDGMKISEQFADAIRLLMFTGCRKQEILKLQWAWVDLGRGVINFPDSKGGKKVTHLPPAAVELLSSLDRKPGNPFVLPSRVGTDKAIDGLQKLWDDVRTLATEIGRKAALAEGKTAEEAPDLINVRVHDLRHSFASFAAAAGNGLFVIGKALGHKQVMTTARYAHLADDPLKRAVSETSETIASALKSGSDRARSVNK